MITCRGRRPHTTRRRGASRSRRIRSAALSLSAFWATAIGQAAVVKVEILERTPIAAHVMEQPRHEVVVGRYSGELDRADPRNAIITDLALAPRNARGKVEYSATFTLTRPLDPRAASGLLIYGVPNRGGNPAVISTQGHVHVVSGWQGDLPPAPGRHSLSVPVARHADGSAITGPILVRLVDMPRGTASLPIVSGFGSGVPRPEPVSLDTAKATLIRKRSDTAAGERIPAARWAFADCTQAPFPGVANPGMLCLQGGFDPAFAYELTYTGKDPPVLGIGFAAVRDLIAFLRYSPGSPAAPNPVAGQVRKTIGTGVSQSGNFLRSFIHLGFNAAEDGGIVFDGVNAHAAPRQLAMNLRFAVPGGAAALYEPGSEAVLWWGRYEDRLRGFGTTSLLDRCSLSRTCPKVFETFGSAEFWALRMSPGLVGTDAKADIPLPGNVRRYYFPGTTHVGGRGGFATAPQALAKPPGCTLAGNPNPMSPSLRALTQALIEWVMDGKEPPPSRYPRLAAGDLVPPEAAAMGFPRIPGWPSPEGKLNALPVYDFGPDFHGPDLSGQMAFLPPKVLGQTAARVPRVDADGNETSGIRSVQLRVPLGTYLGWNAQATGYHEGAACGFHGSFIPFARTRAERLAGRDPRLSLEERYGTHAGFVEQVKAATAELVREGFLLPEDARQIVEQAAASDVLTDPSDGTPRA